MSVAAVKFNRLPIIFALIVLTILLGVGLSQCSDSNTVTTTTPPPAAVAAPNAPSRPSDADGTDETLRTLAARLGAVEQVTTAQQATDARLAELSSELEQSRNDPAQTQIAETLAQLREQNQLLTDRILALEARQSAPSDAVNADLGLPPGAAPGLGALDGVPIEAGLAAAPPQSGYAWVRPLDQPPRDPADPSSPVPSGYIAPAPGEIAPVDVGQTAQSTEPTVTPRFTIPVNATLLNNRALTALIGRIPVNGSVTDPYRFKILASSEGLATNGFYLPSEIRSMVFSGTASGDWSLKCVRGSIDSVTFTYEDGSVQTYGGEIATPDGANQSTTRKPLGYLSDRNGVPCIKGEPVTNAPKILTARFAAAALEATARGYAEAQTSNTVTAAGGVVRTIDDAAKFGAYTGLAGGAGETRTWLEERLGQIFDAIYAPPGHVVAIHIESQINLDQRSDARKLSYGRPSTTATQLD